MKMRRNEPPPVCVFGWCLECGKRKALRVSVCVCHVPAFGAMKYVQSPFVVTKVKRKPKDRERKSKNKSKNVAPDVTHTGLRRKKGEKIPPGKMDTLLQGSSFSSPL